jgi:hypothetical protein
MAGRITAGLMAAAMVTKKTPPRNLGGGWQTLAREH